MFLVLALLTPATAAEAEYKVESKVEGLFCTGWIFEKCKLKEIDAFARSKDGPLFELLDSFEKVDEFNSKQGRCWLKNRREEYHAFSLVEGEEPEYLGVPDDITFQCRKLG